jgi:hypothetical protein
MAEDVTTTVADGKYYWQLIFSYDNSANTKDLKQTYSYTKKKTVSSKDFLSNKFNVNTGFAYNNKTSVSVKFEGIGEGSSSVEYDFHIDTAYELQKTSETDQLIEEEDKETREYNIGAGGKLNLYQLCYTTDGVAIQADIFASQPQPDAIVKLKFSCHTSILGLEDILELFSHTFPGSSNVQEWTHIRDSIIQNITSPALTQFKQFVETLGGITPGSSNTVEWAAIRTTCAEILAAWNTTDKQLLFKKLLERFSVTHPGSENTVEWAAIRTLSDNILAGLKELP